MKKIILFLICFFNGIFLVNAQTLISEELPYYVILQKGTSNERMLNIKKIYDKDTLEVVFDVTSRNYEGGDNFNIYDEYNNKIWKLPPSQIDLFNNIVYYGYKSNPSDLNYYLTQLAIYKQMMGLSLEMVDENGNKITTYEKELTNLLVDAILHNSKPSFMGNSISKEIWSLETYRYGYNDIILDNPIVENFKFKNKENRYLTIYADKVGTYNLEFYKDYEQENHCYSNGTYIYWQSLKGPSNISAIFNYTIYGTKLKIKENLIGINNRVGDAKLDSKYELYLDNELKLVLDNLEEDIYVKSNSTYLLKDISLNEGVNNSYDIIFDIQDDEYNLVIDKYVVSKNISLTINSDKDYYIYLKSNNELYGIVNNGTDLIILPYGIYYIKDKSNTYFKELIINDNVDEDLVINEQIEEDNNVENSKNEVNEEIEKDSVINENITLGNNVINNPNNNVDNPKTLDNIDIYIFYFCLSLLTIIIAKIIIRKTA